MKEIYGKNPTVTPHDYGLIVPSDCGVISVSTKVGFDKFGMDLYSLNEDAYDLPKGFLYSVSRDERP